LEIRLRARPGHDHEQIDARQSGIQRRDPDLGKHDAAKGCPKKAGSVGERMHQRAWLDISSLTAHRDHPADDHAKQDVDRSSPDILADGAQLPGMLAQPSGCGDLELSWFIRKRAEGPSRQTGARCLDHLGHLLQQHGQVLRSAGQQGNEAQDGSPDGDDDDGSEKGHNDDLARVAADKGSIVTGRQHMHELIDQQSG